MSTTFHALARDNSRQRSTWFFLDEVAEGKKFPYLTKLALKGRSKGCCIVLGFQDIDGVRLTYGEKEGNQIVAMCSYRWLGKIDSDVTQLWASNQLGTKEIVDPTKSVQNDMGNQKTSTQYQSKIVPVVLPSEFGTFPRADFTVNGIKGWYVMPNPIGAYEYTISPHDLTARIPEPDSTIVDFDPITDPMAQYLDDWTPEEREYLGLPELEIEAPKEKEKEKEKPVMAQVDGEQQPEEEDFNLEKNVINGIDFSHPPETKERPKRKPKNKM